MTTTRIPIALAGLLASLFLIGGCSESAEEHYRKNHDGESLYRVLHDQVKPGDSLAKVQGLLGQGEASVARTRAAVKQFAQRFQSQFPAGYQEHDVLVDFATPGGWLTLQFRDNKIINYRPEDYAHYEPMTGATASRPATATSPS